MQPKVAAIVCTIDRPRAIVACVRSLLGNDYAPFEVIVVDQSRDDVTAAALRPLLADARLRYLHIDTAGKTRSQNLAITGSDAEIFAFTDDDCVVPTDWIAGIVASFDRLPDAGVVFGEVRPASTHDWATAFSPSIHVEREQQLRPAFLPRATNLFGCNMAITRRTFERLGLFDELLGPGGTLAPASEEVDFYVRAIRARPPIGVYLTPAFHVVHEYGSRPRGAPERKLLRGYEMGKTAMLTKHALRGDMGAACKLALLALEPLAYGMANLLRTGRPRGAGMIVPYAQGLLRSLRMERGVADRPLVPGNRS